MQMLKPFKISVNLVLKSVADCSVNGLWLTSVPLDTLSPKLSQAFSFSVQRYSKQIEIGRLNRHQHNLWCTCKDDTEVYWFLLAVTFICGSRKKPCKNRKIEHAAIKCHTYTVGWKRKLVSREVSGEENIPSKNALASLCWFFSACGRSSNWYSIPPCTPLECWVKACKSDLESQLGWDVAKT